MATSLFIDDYAHHPHAVALTLETARRRFPGRRIVAVFQPTLYTRLYRFLTPFSEAFDTADEVVIVEIQPSRERDTGLDPRQRSGGEDRRTPAFAGKPDAARYGGDFDETAALLRELRQPGRCHRCDGSARSTKSLAWRVRRRRGSPSSVNRARGSRQD